MNNTEIGLESEFHNVGQGLFYSGKLSIDEQEYHFVYDCGSEKEKRLRKIANRYKESLNGSKIDLLILSHLHNDHTSGLEYLLTDINVDTVILPYLWPKERLKIALEKNNLPPWFYDFLSDPVRYLLEDKEVNTVILIGRENEEDFDFDESVPNDDTDSDEEKTYIKGLKDDDQLIDEITKLENPKLKQYIKNNDLYIKKYRGTIKSLGAWRFKLFNYSISVDKHTDLKLCFERNNLNYSHEEIIKAIKDQGKRDNLRKCYEDLPGNLNRTSLMAFHGPLEPPKIERRLCIMSFFYKHIPAGIWCFPKPLGHLLTGDIKLNFKWGEIKKYYSKELAQVGVIQVPHHGSKHNWNNKILSEVQDVSAWIFSAGISNKHHPSPDVVNEIASQKQSRWYWSNEFNNIMIKTGTKKN